MNSNIQSENNTIVELSASEIQLRGVTH